jgi:hypothetical protein
MRSTFDIAVICELYVGAYSNQLTLMRPHHGYFYQIRTCWIIAHIYLFYREPSSHSISFTISLS